MNLHQPLINLLIGAEGNVPHMYLDTRGGVTVGVGHLLATPDRAAELPFLTPLDVPALEPLIRREWEHVKQLRFGPRFAAKYYAPFCILHLGPAEILALLDKDIAIVEAGVSGRFEGYAQYPPSPQDALLDMGFNLGVAGLSKYVKLQAAAERGDWRACAEECHRNGISDDRNNATKLLFLAGARAAEA